MSLLLCLIFLRHCAPHLWTELYKITSRPSDELRATAIVRRIGEFTDQTLRVKGIPPGVRSTLERLRLSSASDLAEMIGLCNQLGTVALHTLFDHYATAMTLESGDFFTPREVASLMARLAVGDGDSELPVYDPWARGGEMLHAAGDVQPGLRSSLCGASPNRETLRLAGMNLVLHGQPAEFRLSRMNPWDDVGQLPIQASAVVTNPPFNMRTDARPDDDRDSNWLFGTPPKHNNNYAWLQYAVQVLAPGAKAAILMPRLAGVSSDDREHAIRREMVLRGTIEAIIALPSRLFPSTDTAVTVWVLGRPTDSPGRIVFMDATGMGITTRKEKVILPPLAVELISGLYRKRDLLISGKVERIPNGGFVVSANADALDRTNYSLDPDDYIEGGLGVSPLSSDDAEDRIAELARLGAEVERLDAQADQLRPVPRSGFSGALPHGWSRVPLGELCDIQAGPSFKRLGIAERVERGSVPIVMPRHLREGRIVAADADRVSEETALRLVKFRLRVDDILCVRTGAMSQRAIVGEQQEGWLFSTNLHRLRLGDTHVVDPHYLLAFLSLPSVMSWVEGRSKGTVIPFITSRGLGQLMVTIPPLDEQLEIESALNTFDERIAIHEAFARAAATARAALAGQLMEGAVVLR